MRKTFKDQIREKLLQGDDMDAIRQHSESIRAITPGHLTIDVVTSYCRVVAAGGSIENSQQMLLNAAMMRIKASGEKLSPQDAIRLQMAAMHEKAQELTGVSVPKYYNPAAVNPLKYAEQVQKRKLLWSKAKEKKETPVSSLSCTFLS